MALFAPPVMAQEIKEWGSCVVDGVPTLKCFEVVAQNIMTTASALVVLSLFIMLVYGSFTYMTSLGNPERIKKAQGTLRYAVIGLGLFLAAFLIIRLIDILFLGGCGTLLRFEIGGVGLRPC